MESTAAESRGGKITLIVESLRLLVCARSSSLVESAAEARGCRVITVSSGGFKTIHGWLRTSLVVTVISRF
jgi:hypothetical protein